MHHDGIIKHLLRAWPSAVISVVFIVEVAVFMAKKAITDANVISTTIVNAAEPTLQSDNETVTGDRFSVLTGSAFQSYCHSILPNERAAASVNQHRAHGTILD